MIEQLLGFSGGERKIPKPDNSEFIHYYDDPDPNKFVGFYGYRTEASFISFNDLSNALKVPGYATPAGNQWLKYYIDGKIIFIPMRPIRTNLLYENFTSCDLISGKKKINIATGPDAGSYKVRLVNSLPPGVKLYVNPPGDDPFHEPLFTSGSEYNRTLLNMVDDATMRGDRGAGDPPWSDKKSIDFIGVDWSGGNVSYTLVDGLYKSDRFRESRFLRPSLNVNSNLGMFFPLDNLAQKMSWRPVLELL